MEEAIKNFHTQFLWKPQIQNADKLPPAKKFVVGGMGGSHLAAGLLHLINPELDLVIHRDYGLPILAAAPDCLYIASSYSGNTEETVNFAEEALKKGYTVATVSVGGKLLEFAQKNNLPHIVILDTKIQPRSALGFSLLALAVLVGDKKLLNELPLLAENLNPDALEEKGQTLSKELRSFVPVIYSSTRNSAIAYNWKIKFNETGKIPAFYNVFPELNHNEMTGFDAIQTTEGLSRQFHFIFLTDTADHPQIQKRMDVCVKLYKERGLAVATMPLEGRNTPEKIFSSLLIADWTAFHTSKLYGTEAEQVPMVEEFKKLITSH